LKLHRGFAKDQTQLHQAERTSLQLLYEHETTKAGTAQLKPTTTIINLETAMAQSK
jgi:hypothetical protein